MSPIDRYEIIEEVGRGRFAAVYKALDKQHNQLVSLKIRNPDWNSDPDFGGRFKRADTGAQPGVFGECHSSPKIQASALIGPDQSGDRRGMPACMKLVNVILGLMIIGVLFLMLSCSTVKRPVVSPTGITPAIETLTEATPTATDHVGNVEEGQEGGDSLSLSQLQDVARQDTLILGWNMDSPPGVTNPWAAYYNHSEANAMMWEGLAYFRIFADQSQPWLAESMVYTKDDFTELTITLRPEAKWSDGTPVTSMDVLYTLESHLNNDQLPHHAALDVFVSSIEAVDELTTVVTFNQPAPRFAFEVLTLKFDTGIPIVPAHVLEPLDDPSAFAGGLDMPHSGPYTTVVWEETQKILDLREDWWAVEAGLIDTPEVKRIIIDDLFSQFGGDMELVAQRIANNEMDTAVDFRPGILASIIEQNPAVTSHTGDEPPYGYLDWWPNSLWVNTLLPPYDDARLRRAISLAIDRDTIDEIVYEGAQVTTIVPWPLYPGLQNFMARDDVQALIEKYEPRKFDLDESARLMQEAGFILNSSGLWERDGKTVNATIHGYIFIHGDIIPVMVGMLLDAGFDASAGYGDNAYQQMVDGVPGLYMFGHGASIVDPYAALELYHGRFSDPIGTTTDQYHLSRYNNPAYDAILDQIAPLSSDDPLFQALAVQALEIYWRDQIDIPIIQWLHRIPYNQTYWTNWPTADNLGPGVNGAFWHHTGMLVVTSLEKAP